MFRLRFQLVAGGDVEVRGSEAEQREEEVERICHGLAPGAV